MDTKINIICWKWKKTNPPSTKNSEDFTSLHVNTLYSMLQRHLSLPYRLICITDDPVGIHSDIEIFSMINTFAEFGGCYRRLSLFDPNLNKKFGKRFVCIDLDVVIVDDITSIFFNTSDFVIWGEELRKTPYCGSMWMMDSGSRSEVWEEFNKDPHTAINLSKKKYSVGSDQSFISYCLYPNEETWTKKDGIYNFKLDIMKPIYRKQVKSIGRKLNNDEREKRRLSGIRKRAMKKVMKRISLHKPISDSEIIILNKPTGELPINARIIFFNGKFDPSNSIIQENNLWIKDHWR